MDVDHAETEPPHDEWVDIDGEDAGLYALPPGEEGMLHSHAGGESIFQQVIDGVNFQCVARLSYPMTFCNIL
jgi:hypothetical protein